MLVTNRKLLLDAQKRAYAAGAFNIQNLEGMKVVFELLLRRSCLL